MRVNQGGEYYTPQQVSKLLAKLAIDNKTKVKNIYDPTCGSGSLLLQTRKLLGIDNISDKIYGQENNSTAYNLCRMNMFLHNIGFDKFDIKCGDTLMDPKHGLDKKYEIIVSNPPYSIKWEGDSNPLLINDERFASIGVLAPKSKADFAFIIHSLYCLDQNGKAAIVCFPGIFYRGGSEYEIRKYLVENNYIDCIISMPVNLFFGTNIQTNILVLSKSKKDNEILFINASSFYEKRTNKNYLTDEYIDRIYNLYKERKNVDHYAHLASYEEILKNDFNLSVNNYVESLENKQINEKQININELNQEIEAIVIRNDQLRNEIKQIIKRIDHE